MKRKFKYVVLTFLFIVIVFILYRQFIFRYNKNTNDILYDSSSYSNIPPLENDWLAIEKDSSHILYGRQSLKVNTNDPMHLYKEIQISGDKKISELDAFHFETNSSIAYRLICEYFYVKDSTSCRLIKYYKNIYPPTKSFKVSELERDSIFSEWKFPSYYN